MGHKRLAGAARYTSAVQSDAIMILPITEPGNAAESTVFQRARAGDVTAFEQLLHVHERSVLRLAARLTGNLDDAKDISQEVFLKLHRELRSFATARRLRPGYTACHQRVLRPQDAKPNDHV